MDAKHYRRALQQLLPFGLAWPREPDAVLTRLLAGLAEVFARIHARATVLLGEGFPLSATETLPEWERDAGLPDVCSAGVATTLEDRRHTIEARLTGVGGQTPAYFIRLAATLGYEISVTEYRAFRCGLSPLGGALAGGHMLGGGNLTHHWRVTVHGPRASRFATGLSRLGNEPLLALSRAEDLECLLQRHKPAHTILTVSYEGA